MTGAGGEVKRSHLIRNNLEGLYFLDPYMDRPATNSKQIMRMKKLLRIAMEVALTDRQREVVRLYYLDEKKAIEIAGELGISKQAVHRLLRDSIIKLKRIKNIF